MGWRLGSMYKERVETYTSMHARIHTCNIYINVQLVASDPWVKLTDPWSLLCTCMYVVCQCMYELTVCMYGIYTCLHACMYVCIYVCVYVCIYVCMQYAQCMYVCMNVPGNVLLCVCMHACMAPKPDRPTHSRTPEQIRTPNPATSTTRNPNLGA